MRGPRVVVALVALALAPAGCALVDALGGSDPVDMPIDAGPRFDAAPLFQPRMELTIPMAYSVAGGDLDGDSFGDVVITTRDSQVAVLRGSSFPAIEMLSIPGPRFGFYVTIADLDTDGRGDIIATTNDGVAVLRQLEPIGGALAFAPAMFVPVGVDSWRTQVGDLDQDGRPDLAIADFTGTVWVLFQDPTGGAAFTTAPLSFSQPAAVSSVAIADLDDDGANDIAFVMPDARVVSSYRQVLLAPGTFSGPTELWSDDEGEPWDLVATDLNSDGAVDVVVAANRLLVLLNDPAQAGTFAPPMTYPAFGFPQLVSGDVTGDGFVDIAGGNETAVILFFQTAPGNGAFPSQTLLQTTLIREVALSDLNGDLREDVIAVEDFGTGTGTVYVWMSP